MRGDVSKAAPAIKANDIIYVPRMEVFYIYGEVQRPGEYPLRRPTTVMQALSISGGLTAKGTERGLKISRKSAQGSVETVKVKLTDELRPGDVVFVKEGLLPRPPGKIAKVLAVAPCVPVLLNGPFA